MKIPLDPPFDFEDYHITEIDLNLKGKINPKTQEILEARYKREFLRPDKSLEADERGVYNEKPMVDKRFRLLVFEFVTGLPKEAIRNENFPLETYNVILDSIAYFFINWREPSTELPANLEEEPGEV